ncbi:hypothetical protein ACIPSJ_26095 [Streptomyces sp. NPDC090088]
MKPVVPGPTSPSAPVSAVAEGHIAKNTTVIDPAERALMEVPDTA